MYQQRCVLYPHRDLISCLMTAQRRSTFLKEIERGPLCIHDIEDLGHVGSVGSTPLRGDLTFLLGQQL